MEKGVWSVGRWGVEPLGLVKFGGGGLGEGATEIAVLGEIGPMIRPVTCGDEHRRCCIHRGARETPGHA